MKNPRLIIELYAVIGICSVLVFFTPWPLKAAFLLLAGVLCGMRFRAHLRASTRSSKS